MNRLYKVSFLVFMFFVLKTSFATVFYSQGNVSQSFADLSNWNSIAGGGGVSPVAGDLTNGLHYFVIKNGHTVNIDLDINVDGLIVGQGGGGTSVLAINGAAVRSITVKSSIYVDSNGDFRPDNTTITHNITLTGASATVTNLGTFNPRRDANSLATFTISGATAPSIAGNSAISFYSLTINGGGTVSTSGTIYNYGDLVLSGNSTLIGSADIRNRAGVNVNAGSEIDLSSSGTFRLEETSDQSMVCDGECEFYNFLLDNGPGAAGVKTVTGKITVINRFTIQDDAVFASSDSVILKNQLYIYNANGWTGSGPIRFIPAGTGVLNGNNLSVALGTSELIIDGNVNVANNTNTILLNGNLTVTEGNYLLVNQSAAIRQAVAASNVMTLEAGALLYVRGVNNFPINFSTYNFDVTSRTIYDGSIGLQLIYGATYGDLVCTNNTKNSLGSVTVRGNLTVNNSTTMRFLTTGHNLVLEGNVNGNGGTLISNNTVTLNGVDKDQTMDPDVAYTLTNLVINNVGPITGIRTKNIDNNISVSGNFTVTNTGGNASNYLIVDIDANNINGGGAFTINDHVELRTSGVTAFEDMFDASAPSFSSVSLASNSTIRFDGTTTQEIPGLNYGNIILANGTSKTLTGNITINGDMDGNRNSYVFNDAGFTITAYGDWDMGNFGSGFARTNMTGNFIFAGGNQISNESDFYNVVFSGTGTKTMNFHINVGCGFTIEDGVTFSSDYNVEVGCNVLVNGTGKLEHNDLIFYFDGLVDQDITINTPSASFLNNVSITNGSGTVNLNSDLDVNGYFTMNNGTAVTLNMDDDTLYVGGDFTMYSEDVLSMINGTIVFDGGADQVIRNGNAATSFNNIYFRSGGEKRFSTNTVDINGDVVGDPSVTINQNGVQLNVAGDWTHYGSIGGGTGNAIYFDGANQLISGSEFNTVYFAGTDTKTLGTNSNLKGDLNILAGATLDASVSDYSISVEGNWINDFGGYFESRAGTVTLIGSGSNIYTGGIGAGKAFNNLTITLNSAGFSVTIQDRNPDAVDAGVDLDVDGTLLINRGRLNTGSQDVYVGGDFLVNSNGRFVASNNNHELYFDGAATTKNIRTETSGTYRDMYFNAVGANWQMLDNIILVGGRNLTINNGTLDLNGNSFTLQGNADVLINGADAELEIDAGAVLTMGNNTNSDILNTGGSLRIVGIPSSSAIINSASSYNIIQTGATATISAAYYSISGLRGNGIDIQEGSIDAVENFSNGTFLGGVGTAYLTIHNTAFATDVTITNVTFNESSSGVPTYNASHTGGIVITFEDSKGSATGPSRENDDGSAATGFIMWDYSSSFFWTGLDATDPTNWDRPNNWSNLVVPLSTSDIILDHTNVAGAYTININTTYSATVAKAASINIIDGAGGKITLDLNGKSLNVDGDLSIGSLNEIEQSTSTDTLFIAGSFSNTSGILDGAGATVVFDGVSGNYSISTNSSTNANRDFNDVIFRGGAVYTMTDISEIEGDLRITGSTLSLGDPTNRIEILGDFIISDSGSFHHVNGDVYFEGTTGVQTLDFGGQPLHDVFFFNASQKNIISNLVVENDIFFNATTGTVDAGDNIIFVQHDWRNSKGTDAFVQSGSGIVFFNGVNTQDIGQSGDASTIFNDVIFQSVGAKSINSDLVINGELNILMETSGGLVELNSGYSIIGSGTDNRILMQDGIFRIEGNSFPSGFEIVNLISGEVRYESSNASQNIYPTTYNNLRLREVGTTTQNKEVTGDVVVNGSFIIDDGNGGSATNFVQLKMNCNSLTINGAMSIYTNNPQIDWGSACITTCGTGGTLVLGENITSIDPDLTSFHNITIDNNGVSELRLTSPLTLEGDFVIADGAFFDMQTNTVTNVCTDIPNPTSFILNDNARLQTQVAAGSDALPSSFGEYIISSLSLVEYQRSGAQDVFTNSGNIVYGNLNLQQSGTKTLDGDLSVLGNFDMDGTSSLVDGGNNMTFTGGLVVFNGYTATAGTRVDFDGDDQTIRVDNGTTASFSEVVFAGNGTKLFWNDEVFNFNGNFMVGEDVVIDFFTYNQDVSFSGDSIIVNGTLIHDGSGNDFRFNKNGVQIVDLGANHDIAHLEIKSNANVFIINNGLNVTGNGGTQNFVEIETGASLDLDTLTHYFSQDLFIVDGTLSALNADLVFNQDGTQAIDAFEANNVLFTGAGDKDMNGIWRINNMTVAGGVRIDFNGEDTLVIRGDLVSQGDFNSQSGVLRFEIDDNDARSITTNNAVFAQVKFLQAGGTATYTLQDDLLIDDTLRIGTGATLDLNGKVLYMGSPADGGADTELLVIESGAELQVDGGSSLLFECNGNDPIMNVYGTLTLVGSSVQAASISRYSGNNEIDINIIGGTIAARYYSISNLVNAGLYVDDNSVLDPVNNFSDGSFSNMQEGQGAVYLHLEADMTGVDDIKNISFTHSNPVVGNDFNVRRNRLDGGVVTFDNNISGSLGGYVYESEIASPGLGDRIVWPVNDITNWLGGDVAGENDWFNTNNWDNGVPDSLKTANIGSRPFLPIIGAGGADTAYCKELNLIASSANLKIRDGIDLVVKGSVQAGTGNQSTSIEVQSSTSDILIGGSLFLTNNSTFQHGNSTVIFNAFGSVSVDIDDQSFYNVEFNGAASYNLVGNIDIDGDLTLAQGTLVPATANYTYTVGGDWDGSGGIFNTSINGTVILDGADQDIVNAVFDNLTINGTACDTVKGTLRVNDELIVNQCIAAASGAVIDMNDDVIINASGSFDDGGGTHTFSGVNWTGLGAFPTNTGTISFDRSGGTQNIFDSKFNNLAFVGTSRIEMEGDIDVTANVTINNTINRFYTQQHILNNTTGAGTFTLGNAEFIYVDGANNFPSNFSTYSIGATSNTYYNGTSDQIILGGVGYGNVYLQNLNTKTINGGDIGIKGNLSITDATLDVSSNNYTISIGGNWNNAAGGSFIARKGTVVFNGSGAQAISPGLHPSDGVKKFWNITAENTSPIEDVDLNGADIYIDSTLKVTDGIFTLAGIGGGWTAFVGGSLIASGDGIFANTGFFRLNSTVNSGATSNLEISGNGSPIADIVITSSANTVYDLTSDLIVNGNFNLQSSRVNVLENTATFGTDINDGVTIAGTLALSQGSQLLLGNQTSLTVTNSGTFELIGASGNPAVVSRRYSTGDYNFVVNGNISAYNYQFGYMSTQGILINSTATIHNTYNFSEGTFTNPATSGVCLRIENTQKFTTAAGNRIENVSFPQNPGAGTFNVSKTVAASDTIEFYSATGALSGENYDNDPSDLIEWTGPVKMIWTGAQNADWFNVNNWSATSGPTQVPDSTFDVIIPFVSNQPVINHSGASAKVMSIEAGAIVIIATPNDTASDLTVYDELVIEGIIRTNTVNDVLEVRGDWTRLNSGLYSYSTGGTVVLATSAGTLTLNNGTSPFYDIDVNTDGSTILLATDISIDNDLSIISGVLDVSSSNNQITIGGNFMNTGTFVERNGLVKFVTSNTVTIDGTNTDFYNLEMSGTGTLSMVSDVQVDNILSVSSGLFELNGNSLFMGDASGTDLLRINGGTLLADAGSFIKVASNGGISVSSGGLLQVLGDDLSNRATVTNQSGSSKYSFTIANGGSLEAKYYTISYLNANGVNFQSGSLLDFDNNLSYGTLTNGTSGGTFMTFGNSQALSGNNQIEYVEFASNPGGGASNAKKTNGVGNVKFYYAFGAFQGEDYDNDPADRIVWDADIVWTGAVSSDWNDPANWNPVLEVIIPDLVPTILTDVIIPDAGTTPNAPVLTINGFADDLLIETNGLLTINSDANLTVKDSVIVEGVLTIDNGSDTDLSLGGSWVSSLGTFNSGNASEVIFTADAGVESIITNDAFCGIRINSSSPSTGTIQTGNPLNIDCDLSIDAGILLVANSSHTINLFGNWDNNRTSANTGFNAGTGTVVFDGTSDQSISHAGGSETFYNLTISNSGAVVNLDNHIIINNDLVIDDNARLVAQTSRLSIDGDWINNNSVPSTGFDGGTGRVRFTGSSQQTLSHAGGHETLNDVILNNSASGTSLLLNVDLTIEGFFTQTDGIVTTNGNELILTNTVASDYSGFSNTSFVNGTLTRYIATNSSTYSFPVAQGTTSGDYFRIDMINNNLTGVTSLTGSVAGITESGDNIDGNVDLEEYSGGATYLSVAGETAIWTLTPNVQPTGGSYGIRAYVANFGGLVDDLFALVKRNEGSTTYADWDDNGATTSLPAPGQPGRTVASGYALRLGWTSFSEFGVGITDIPLPIELLSFDVKGVSNSVHISWTTLTERNNDYFTIERSVDGINFTPVGYVDGAGNSLESISYSFIDSKPVSGISYYRLRQTDFDGKTEAFEIKAIELELASFGSVYPNPASSVVYITSANSDLVAVEIYSSLGTLVFNSRLEGQDQVIDITGLSSGVYTVIVSGINWVQKEKLVISK